MNVFKVDFRMYPVEHLSFFFAKVKQGQVRLNSFAIKALEQQHPVSPVAAQNGLPLETTQPRQSAAKTRTAALAKLRLGRMPAGGLAKGSRVH